MYFYCLIKVSSVDIGSCNTLSNKIISQFLDVCFLKSNQVHYLCFPFDSSNTSVIGIYYTSDIDTTYATTKIKTRNIL